MRFELDEDQQALLASVSRILAERAGPERVRQLGGAAPEYDHDLDAVLHEHGYLGFTFGDGAGALEAALVVEAVAQALGVVGAGADGLVGPGAVGATLPGPIAVTGAPGATGSTPVRFAADASTLLVVGADEATVVELGPESVDAVESRFGYPLAKVRHWDGESLGPGSAHRVLAWWRVALAAELVGTMRGALDMTVQYVATRRQFERPLGSFQAIQHRLAECEMLVQGSRWMALEAAWAGARPEDAAAALTSATTAANRVFWETHQFSGAMGFSEEYNLHLWTMRIPALRAEANAGGAPAVALTVERWMQHAS